MKKKLAVLISGSGTNLQSIIENVNSGFISNAEIAVVMSNNKDAYGLKRALNYKINTEVLEHSNFSSREAFEDELIRILNNYNIDFVVLAGFMRILTKNFISAFKNKIINIHPALLPSFQGEDAQVQAFKYGVKFAGCTVHFVDEGVDTGAIIVQAVVPVLQKDTEETLKKRILNQEHKILPYAIKLLTEDKLFLDGRKVLLLNQETDDMKDIFMINPYSDLS